MLVNNVYNCKNYKLDCEKMMKHTSKTEYLTLNIKKASFIVCVYIPPINSTDTDTYRTVS